MRKSRKFKMFRWFGGGEEVNADDDGIRVHSNETVYPNSRGLLDSFNIAYKRKLKKENPSCIEVIDKLYH